MTSARLPRTALGWLAAAALMAPLAASATDTFSGYCYDCADPSASATLWGDGFGNWTGFDYFSSNFAGGVLHALSLNSVVAQPWVGKIPVPANFRIDFTTERTPVPHEGPGSAFVPASRWVLYTVASGNWVLSPYYVCGVDIECGGTPPPDADYGYSGVWAVPEPETYATILAGLGVLGAAARRRRKS